MVTNSEPSPTHTPENRIGTRLKVASTPATRDNTVGSVSAVKYSVVLEVMILGLRKTPLSVILEVGHSV